MPLTAGTRIGPYEIIAAIGAGGMGEVYRATDTNLGREVAIKVLPDAFAADANRLARLEREAKTLASLNHPHIAQIYGVERSATQYALVMELVPGTDLSDRIGDRQLPVPEALAIARQIAEALEAAHEAGVVHRDLKPANIKLSGAWGPTPTHLPDGRLAPTRSAADVAGCTVKVLDFGLAKARGPEAAGATADGTDSPTLASPAMTAMGMILGTAAYMSPEQARGAFVDRRADVWAFGCILFEMLTGTRLFAGETTSDSLAAVLTKAPDWSALPATTPESIRRLLRRCLTRDPRQRLDSMAVARCEIDDAAASTTAERGKEWRSHSSVRRPTLAALTAGSLAVGWLLSAWLPAPLGPTAGRLAEPIVTTVAAPADVVSAFTFGFALSPDGSTIALSARSSDGVRAIWTRRLAAPQYERVSGTEDGQRPFWSPDGSEIAFFANGFLKTVALGGGRPPRTLCPAPGEFPRGSWGDRDQVAFSTSRLGSAASVYVVAAGGGTPTKLALDGVAHTPHWLPGGDSLIYVRVDADKAQIMKGSLEGGGQATPLADIETLEPNALFGSPDYLFFNRNGVLMAQRFDRNSGALQGDAVSVGPEAGSPGAWFGASAGGDALLSLSSSTVSMDGDPGDPMSRLQWVGRDGAVDRNTPPPGRYWQHRLSPDGRRVAVNSGLSVWILELATGSQHRVVADAHTPVWSPDGGRLVLRRQNNGLWSYPTTRSSGAGVQLLKEDESYTHSPVDWSKDGRILLMTRDRATDNLDVWVVSQKDPTPRPLMTSPYTDTHARFSSNGEWVAYTSDATNRMEVYVVPSNGRDAPIQISTGGGEHPQWSRDGRELFYITPTDELIAVDVTRLNATRAPGLSGPLFRVVMNDIVRRNHAAYDVGPDRRFLVNISDPPEPLTLIQHVSALFRAR